MQYFAMRSLRQLAKNPANRKKLVMDGSVSLVVSLVVCNLRRITEGKFDQSDDIGYRCSMHLESLKVLVALFDCEDLDSESLRYSTASRLPPLQSSYRFTFENEKSEELTKLHEQMCETFKTFGGIDCLCESLVLGQNDATATLKHSEK